MEDYNSNLLNDSKNEWSIRLMNILCGHVIDGFRSIFNESIELCEKNEEPEKYLMTFQNFLSRIPKWNQNMIETECTRIVETSQCKYLDDLITCVHVIQLKILSCVRTNNQSKKIDIDIPQFNAFLHNVYINIARKLYSNIYLFQVDISPLEQQKNNREFENIVQISIMNTIRDNIPIDQLLKQYMDETQELDVEERIVSQEKVVDKKKEPVEETVPKVNKPEEDENIFGSSPESIRFDNNVEKYDPINEEKKSEPINFESKPEPASLYDDDDDDNESITIGESINLKFGEENNSSSIEPSNDIVPIDLNILPIEDTPPPEPKKDVIDLGIEEIKL
tara:strand:- start:12195 stop:13202 length:1008 start_codon:yes stop_codon:yes gene_type:complete